jgi:DNA polymerase III delta prime subunit
LFLLQVDTPGNPMNIKKTIQNMFTHQKFDNLIVMGGECMGKTTLLKYIITEHLKDEYKYLFINYLDDKGIDMIRTRIKHFTNLKSPKQKFVLIDDADDLSTSAQQSLRRIIEQKYKTCSFIFTIKNFKNLIFPIHSRCLLFELPPITHDLAFTNENISIDGTKTKKEVYKQFNENESLLHTQHSKILNEYKIHNPLKYIKEYSKSYTPFKVTELSFGL